MKSSLHIFIVLFLIMVNVCCSHKPDSRLTAAESLMDSRPDSALMILDSIRPETLRGDADRALYALLLTQAQDKNHLNPTNDSLITSAVSYYGRKEDESRYATASHYQGRVRQNNKDYSRAIISYYTAKEAAASTGQYLIAGLASRGISDIYSQTYNIAEELKYATQEYEYTLKSGEQPYMNYAINDYARALVNTGDAAKAMPIINQGLDSARASGDEYLMSELLRFRRELYLLNEDYKGAMETAEEICRDGYASASDTLMLGLTMAESGMADKALQLIEPLKDTEPEQYGYVKYRAYARGGKAAEAFSEQQAIDTIRNERWELTKNMDLGSSLADYYEVANNYNKAEIKNQKQRQVYFWTTAAFLTVIAGTGLGIWVIIQRGRRIKMELMYTQLTHELQRMNVVKSEVDATLASVVNQMAEKDRVLTETEKLAAVAHSEARSHHQKAMEAMENARIAKQIAVAAEEKAHKAELQVLKAQEAAGIAEKQASEAEKRALMAEMEMMEAREEASVMSKMVEEAEDKAHAADRQRVEAEQLRQRAEQQVGVAEEKASEAEKRAEEREKQKEAAESKIQQLIYSKYKQLDPLCKLLLEPGNEKVRNEKTVAELKRMISGMTLDGRFIKEVEKEINAAFSDLIKELRQDIPRFDSTDIYIYLLSGIGFTPAAISLLLHQDINKIYTRKRTVKGKIDRLSKDKSFRYMNFLNQE